MDGLEVIAPPTGAAVSVDELKAHLRLNDATENAQLADWLQAAAELFEADTGRPLLSTGYRQWVGRWGWPVVLARGAVTAVTAVKRQLADGSLEAVAGWVADVRTPPPRVYLPGLLAAAADGFGRPVSPAGCVEFTAGWASPAAVPAAVRVALKLLAAHWYEAREAYRDSAFEMRETPQGWGRVTANYKTGGGGFQVAAQYPARYGDRPGSCGGPWPQIGGVVMAAAGGYADRLEWLDGEFGPKDPFGQPAKPLPSKGFLWAAVEGIAAARQSAFESDRLVTTATVRVRGYVLGLKCRDRLHSAEWDETWVVASVARGDNEMTLDVERGRLP